MIPQDAEASFTESKLMSSQLQGRGLAELHGFVALNALAIGSCCNPICFLAKNLDSRGQRLGLSVFFDPANIYCVADCVPHALIYAENI